MPRIDDQVGQIGLGSIGQIYARHLLDGAGRLLVHDRDEDAVREVVQRGAVSVASCAELAGRCDVIVLALPTRAPSNRSCLVRTACSRVRGRERSSST